MMATGSTADGVRSEQALLGIYLNGHLAGDTGGLELARRAAHPIGVRYWREARAFAADVAATVLRCGA